MSNPIITKPIETRLITQGQAGIIMAQVCDLSYKGEKVAEFPEITPVGHCFEYSVSKHNGPNFSDFIFKMELVDEESLERFMTKYRDGGWDIKCYGERFCVHLTMSRKAWQILDEMADEGITGSLYYA